MTTETVKQETNRKVGQLYHSEKAKTKARKSGMVFPSLPNIPDYCRDEYGAFLMPPDITALSPQELGQLYSLLTGLSVYYGGLVALADIDRNTAERIKIYIEAQVFLEIDISDPEVKKKFPNRELQEAFVFCDDRVVEVQDWFDRLNADYILAEAIYKGYEKNINLVSREITRRSNFQDWNNRENNLK